MTAANHLGYNVEQLLEPYGWVPLNAVPHDSEASVQAEFDSLIRKPGERRIFEALELHPDTSAKMAVARAALRQHLGLPS